MKYVDAYGNEIKMMSPPMPGYKNVYQLDDNGRAKEVDVVWGFWSETDFDGTWIFFDTPDDETYDIRRYEIYYEPRGYDGE